MKLEYESPSYSAERRAERRVRTRSFVYGTLAACAVLSYALYFLLLWLGIMT